MCISYISNFVELRSVEDTFGFFLHCHCVSSLSLFFAFYRVVIGECWINAVKCFFCHETLLKWELRAFREGKKGKW